jgi:hypothetical protein
VRSKVAKVLRNEMLDEAAALTRDLALLRKRAITRMSHTAFVHFPSIRTATVAPQVCAEGTTLNTTPS